MHSRLIGGLPLVAILAVGLVLGGCGSSKKSTTTTTAAPLTKAEFVKQANAVCTKGTKQNAAAQKALGSKKPTQAQLATFTKTFVPNVQGQIDAIRELAPPTADQAKVTAMLNIAQADLNKVKADPTALFKGDLFANFAKLAHPYGLTSCARNS